MAGSPAVQAAAHPGNRRSLMLLVAADGISTTGDWVLNTAASIAVFARTGSTTAVSLLLALALVPTIVLGPFAGAFADRHDRRSVLVLSDCASAGVLFAVTGLARIGFETAAIYAAVLILAGLAAVRRPAAEAMRPAIAGDDGIGRANALVQAATRLAMILGPAVAGALMAGGGLRLALVCDALSFVASAVLVTGVRRHPVLLRELQQSAFRAAAEGLRFARSDGGVRTVVATVGVVMLAAPVVNAGTLALVRDELVLPESRYGILLSFEGLGAMAAAILLASYAARVPMLPAGLVSVIVAGAATVGLGAAPGIGVAAAAMVFMGVGVVGFQVGLASYVQARTPDHVRGRVMGLTAMTASFASLAGFAGAGPFVDVAGVRLAFFVSGGIIVLTAIPLFVHLSSERGRRPAAATEGAVP